MSTMPRLVRVDDVARAARRGARRRRRGPRIDNHTRLQNRDVRQVIDAGLRAEGVDPSRYHVIVRTSRRRIHGRASIGWPALTMWVPTGRDVAGEDMATFARVLVHEIAHTRGVQHDDMDCATMWCRDVKVEWAAGLVMRVPVTKAKPSRDEARAALVERRAARDAAALARWQATLRRAQRAVAKLRGRIGRREQRAALRQAAGSGEAPRG